MEKNDDFKVVNIHFLKKIWFSITKFERYPEMATEGVGRSISYLAKLMLIFAIISSSCMLYNFHNTLKQGINIFDENISEINYKDGTLEIKPYNEEIVITESEMGTLIIDTTKTKDETIKKYEEIIKENNLGIIWLKDKVILYEDGIEEAYYYGELLEKFEITEFNKTDLINYIDNNNTIYIVYFIVILISGFIVYFIATILDVLVLSVVGLITSYMAGIKMRYRAIFNMSVYALTISIILKLIYVLVGMFSDFTIKYFDFMYSVVGYICLVAAIFMIKSDVIKQQIELMKIREQLKEEQENKTEEKEEKEEKEDKEDEKNKEEDDAPQSDGTENQGSQA